MCRLHAARRIRHAQAHRAGTRKDTKCPELLSLCFFGKRQGVVDVFLLRTMDDAMTS
jgi:hypothetical protein